MRISDASSQIGLLNALGRAQRALADSGHRLATGQRINAGRDDPAGLIASENLEAQLAALDAESRALERNDAVARTAEAALAEAGGMLVRKESLAVAAANTGAMSDAERAAIELEMASIDESVERTISSASFGGVPLFNGGLAIPAAGDSLELPPAPEIRDAATITELRGRIGSFQRNTLDARAASVRTEFENVAAANSIIRDTDFAREAALFTRGQILNEAGLSALAIAASRPRSVLDLLGG